MFLLQTNADGGVDSVSCPNSFNLFFHSEPISVQLSPRRCGGHREADEEERGNDEKDGLKEAVLGFLYTICA